MKKYLTIGMILIFLSTTGWIIFKNHNPCLFIEKGRCYTCKTPTEFWVGLPENCQLCPNRYAQYVGDDLFPIWDCLPFVPTEETQPSIPMPSLNASHPCPKEKPLKDVVGHCYSCGTKQPVRVFDSHDSVCMGKRYLTEHRLSEKSNLCPDKKDIHNPEVCLNCQGYWYNDSCHIFKGTPTPFCRENSDCPADEWCFPFRYPYHDKIGVCRPHNTQNWICSDTDGYNMASAKLFCERQGSHIPNLETLTQYKEIVLNVCPNQDIWIFYEDSTLYLKSLSMPFLFTREGMNTDYGGDKFHALCQKD